jgi:hypothetical protein
MAIFNFISVIEALKTDHIKIVLFILRIIDKEESYV